ncbi:MAG TPA: beta-galactosidase, partial [Duganella sp.]
MLNFTRIAQKTLAGLGGATLALSCAAQELGIPQASDADRQTTQSRNGAGEASAFLMASFNNTSENMLSLFSSVDGVTFTSLASDAYTPPNGLMRDPAIIRHSDGYYYVVYATGATELGLTRSKDLKHWQFVRNVPITLPTAAPATAPEWLRDKDGSLKLIVSAAKGGAFIITPNADFSAWSAPKRLQGLPADYVDTVVALTDDGYAALSRNGATALIEMASAKSLLGPWTVGKRGDWAQWGPTSGAHSVVKLSNGHWRLYFGSRLGGSQGSSRWYSDSQDGMRTWSAAKQLGGVSGIVSQASVLVEDGKALAQATKPKGQPKKVSWDEHSMLIDGKRIVVWSGEIHPFRLPNPSLWRDVMQKMKAVGFNGVAFYFDWGYHSSAPGVYDFSHVRNVERALEIAEEEGMYVIARTGPYVNAELTGGGYPGWMFRNRAEARTDDPVYLGAVDEWMTQINAIIARHQITTGGGNVIAYQLENELGKVEPKHVRHMDHLAKKARADGISVPFFHNAAGRLPDWTPKDSTAP